MDTPCSNTKIGNVANASKAKIKQESVRGSASLIRPSVMKKVSSQYRFISLLMRKWHSEFQILIYVSIIYFQERMNVGEVVFAKVLHWPFWPAKILNVRTYNVQVRFFGTDEIQVIDLNQVCDFAQKCDKFRQARTYKYAQKLFDLSIQQAIEYSKNN